MKRSWPATNTRHHTIIYFTYLLMGNFLTLFFFKHKHNNNIQPHKMEDIQHNMVAVNGINMHVAELGKGPTILFIHGFPELWYTWRHQMIYLASHGYRAVAPDLRGYGDTTGAPTNDPTKFTTLHVVGDLVGLIEAVVAPGEEKVFVVGHDWGAFMAWALCLYRPDKVKAVVNLSVPFSPRNPKFKPVDALRALYGNDYYIIRFQEPGEIEGELAVWGTERFLNDLFNYRKPEALLLPKGNGFGTSPNDPLVLPSWLSKEDLAYYTSKFEKTGFTGGLNYYRALNINWELTAAWTGAQVKVPVKFIVGDLDLTYNTMGAKDYIERGGFKKDVPLLEDVIILKDVSHFLHEEKPDEINQYIHHFFNKF
ncbi:putative soluble epoxide hydrolase [Helianthus anomalus]